MGEIANGRPVFQYPVHDTTLVEPIDRLIRAGRELFEFPFVVLKTTAEHFVGADCRAFKCIEKNSDGSQNLELEFRDSVHSFLHRISTRTQALTCFAELIRPRERQRRMLKSLR